MGSGLYRGNDRSARRATNSTEEGGDASAAFPARCPGLGDELEAEPGPVAPAELEERAWSFAGPPRPLVAWAGPAEKMRRSGRRFRRTGSTVGSLESVSPESPSDATPGYSVATKWMRVSSSGSSNSSPVSSISTRPIPIRLIEPVPVIRIRPRSSISPAVAVMTKGPMHSSSTHRVDAISLVS